MKGKICQRCTEVKLLLLMIISDLFSNLMRNANIANCFISTRLLLVTGSCPLDEESLIIQNERKNVHVN